MHPRLSEWQRRTAPYQGPALLLFGGVWDYYTLRLERLLDNGLLFAYLVVFAAATAADLGRDGPEEDPPGWRAWALHLAGQFSLGGLLSAYFIHYLRGAPVQRELTWLLLLGALALFTELRPTLTREPIVRLPLLAFAAFNYFLAALPLLTGMLMGATLPLLLAAVVLGITVGVGTSGRALDPSSTRGALAGLGALGLQVALVLMDAVPPLPLTLMTAQVDTGVADELVELGTATELLAPVGLFTPELSWTPGAAVRMRTPVYLPQGMSTQIVHHWQRHANGAWVTTDRIPLSIRGGRAEGFRTFSVKRRTEPGSWRVRIETNDRRELGRIHFDLVTAAPDPATFPDPSAGR